MTFQKDQFTALAASFEGGVISAHEAHAFFEEAYGSNVIIGGDFSLLKKSVGFAGQLPIIAIGPQGGKIVGYGSGHKPIYQGSAAYKALLAHKEKLASGNEVESVLAWLADALGIKAHSLTGQSSTLSMVPAQAQKLHDAFGIPTQLTGPACALVQVKDLLHHVGKPLVPAAKDAHAVFAALASGTFGPDDAPFSEDTLKSLKVTSDLGGSHGGKIVEDANGKKYAWKTNHNQLPPTRAEEAFCRVGRLCFPEAFPAAETVSHGGETGVLLSWVGDANLGTDAGGVPKETLKKHWLQLVQHQVFDWLMGNHDAHGANFKIGPSGKVVAIDKGQAFKFMGSDVLSTTYKPNEFSPVYNGMWSLFQKGELPGDPVKAVEKVLKKLKNVSVEQYGLIIAPYIEALKASSGIAQAEKVRSIAIARFNTITPQFEAFLTQVTGKPVKLDLGDEPAPITEVQSAPAMDVGFSVVTEDQYASLPVGTKVKAAAPSWVKEPYIFEKKADGSWSDAEQAYSAEKMAKESGNNEYGPDKVILLPVKKPKPTPAVSGSAEPAPLSPPPVVIQKPGWPITKGGVTVHSPGEVAPSGVKWPKKYPGPGFKADVKYKGKTYGIEWGVKADAFHGVVTLPNGDEVTASSPQEVADKLVLFEKGKPLDASSTQLKEWKIGYSIGKLLKLDEFSELFQKAASTDEPGPQEKTVTQLEADKTIVPAKKELTLHEMVSALPDGEVKDLAMMPPSLQKHVQTILGPTSPDFDGLAPLAVLKVNENGKVWYFSGDVGEEGNALLRAWLLKPDGSLLVDGALVDASLAASEYGLDALPDFQKLYIHKKAPAPPPEPVKSPIPVAPPPPKLPTSSKFAWEGAKAVLAEDLASLPAGTVVSGYETHPSLNSSWTKLTGGMWMGNKASMFSMPHSLVGKVLKVDKQPGVPGWNGTQVVTAGDVAMLPDGTVLTDTFGPLVPKGALHPGEWVTVPAPGKAYSCQLPPDASFPSAVASAVAAQSPPQEVPPPAPSVPAQPSITKPAGPKFITPENLKAEVPKAAHDKFQMTWKQVKAAVPSSKDPGAPSVMSKSPEWPPWVPPPGQFIAGEISGQKFWVTESLAGFLAADEGASPLEKAVPTSTMQFVVVMETGSVFKGKITPNGAHALASALFNAGIPVPKTGNVFVDAVGTDADAYKLVLGLEGASFPAASPPIPESTPLPAAASAIVSNPQDIEPTEKPKAVSAAASIEAFVSLKSTHAKYGWCHFSAPSEKAGAKWPQGAKYLNLKGAPEKLDQLLAENGFAQYKLTQPAVSFKNKSTAWCVIHPDAFKKPDVAAVMTVAEAAAQPPAPVQQTGGKKAWDGMKSVTVGTLNALPVGTVLAGLSGAKFTKQESGKWEAEDADQVHASEMAGWPISISFQPTDDSDLGSVIWKKGPEQVQHWLTVGSVEQKTLLLEAAPVGTTINAPFTSSYAHHIKTENGWKGVKPSGEVGLISISAATLAHNTILKLVGASASSSASWKWPSQAEDVLGGSSASAAKVHLLESATIGSKVEVDSEANHTQYQKQGDGKWVNTVDGMSHFGSTTLAHLVLKPVGEVESGTPFTPTPLPASPVAYPKKIFTSHTLTKLTAQLSEFETGTKLSFASGKVYEKLSSGKWDSQDAGLAPSTKVAALVKDAWGSATVTPPGGTAPPPPPPPKPVPPSPEQLKAAAEAKKALEEKKAKLAVFKEWEKKHPKVTDPHFLKALAWQQQNSADPGKPFAAHVGDDETILLGPEALMYGESFPTVETPIGPLHKISTAELAKKWPGAEIIQGPDGKEYPAGTIFQKVKKPTQTKQQAMHAALPGLKFTPHASIDSLVVAKLGPPTDENVEKLTKAASALGLSSKGAVKGGSYSMLFLDKAATMGPAALEEVVEAEIPGQPPPFLPKPPPFAIGALPQGSPAVPNSSDLDAMADITPTEWGHAVRIGGAATLWKPILKIKKVKDPSGGDYLEVHGELTSFDPDLSKLSPGKYTLKCTDQKNQFKDGQHTITDEMAQQFPGHSGNTAGGVHVQVCTSSQHNAHINHFTARVPAGKDLRQGLAEAFQLMGHDPADALADHTHDHERIWKKAEIVRSFLGPKCHISKGQAFRKHFADEKWLDAKLKEHNATHLVDAAQVVVGGGNIPRVLVGDISEADLKKNDVRFLYSGTSYAETVVHHLVHGQGQPARSQGYFNGSNAAGGSASQDDEYGGAYGTMLRMVKGSGGTGRSGVGAHADFSMVYHPRVLNRADVYAYNGDSYGTLTGNPGGWNDAGKRREMLTNINAGANEFTFANGVDQRDLAGVMCKTEGDRTELLGKLAAKGILEINGINVGKFVFVGTLNTGHTKAVGLQVGLP